MAWLEEFPGVARAQSAWRLPIGAASPLWAAFGAAAGAGVAWWWLTRWARPVSIEALAPPAARGDGLAPQTLEQLAESPPQLEIALESVEPAQTAQPEPAPAAAAPEKTFEPPAAVGPEPALGLDDLTLMTGIGPKLSQALAARGITRFAQIAAWTPQDLAEVDTALGLKGRAAREAWVAQAKRLSDG